MIGPDDAGKSTFFNLVTGAPQHRYAALRISKFFQITNVFPQLTVLENVRVAAQALVARFDL